jgi:hypothetical protein
MTCLTIATGYNSPPRNPRDADCVFLPESLAFKLLHAGESGVDCGRLVIEYPGRASDRRRAVEDAIRRTPGLDALAVFGHGVPSKLIATGHGMGTVDGLAAALESVACTQIILYACLTGRGTTGFADALADALPWAHVWAHSTAGHATWNPYVELAGGPNGGDPVFTPADGLRWAHWRDRLRSDQRFRLTFWHAGRGLGRAQALEAVRESAGR